MKPYRIYLFIIILLLSSPVLCAQVDDSQEYILRDTLSLEDTNPARIVHLGEIFEKSSSRKSAEKAFELYCQAMKSDYAPAYRKLGDCYLHGVGTDKDTHKAVKLYRVATAKGDPQAWCDLGYCYEQGVGTERSYPNAVKCYWMASEAGIASGIYHLARFYETGLTERQMGDSVGIPRNIHLALQLYQRLDTMPTASLSDPDPLFRLAQAQEPEAMYMIAQRNPYTDDAFYWLSDAAERGYGAAALELAHYYDYAYPPKYSPKKAFKNYLLSAALGYPEAEFELATLYETGRLVGGKDPDKALLWYQKAADHGIAYAAQKVEEMRTKDR